MPPTAIGTCCGRRCRARPSRTLPAALDADVKAALLAAERDPAGLSDAQALALMQADGPALEALCGLADDLRRDVVGDDVTYVVNRNINFTNVCYTGCRFCAFAQRRTDADAFTLSLDEVGKRADEAWAAGATEVCLQGGIHPDLPGTAYFDIAAEIRRRQPDLHIHAFSPMEIINGASRTGMSIRDWLIKARESGLDSIPGTAAEILDDDVRWILTKGKLPTAKWIEVVSTAHQVGLRSSSTMMYGHVDTPAHWVQHLRVLARIQDETGGFTEFVALPFVHQNSPIYLAGVASAGPSLRDNRAVHAMARIMLHGRIDNIQTSWVKLGVDGCRAVLQGGVNDLGGTLMEETISRMAGSQHGSAKSVADLEAIAASAGRPARQRTTLYGAGVAGADRGRPARRKVGAAAHRRLTGSLGSDAGERQCRIEGQQVVRVAGDVGAVSDLRGGVADPLGQCGARHDHSVAGHPPARVGCCGSADPGGGVRRQHGLVIQRAAGQHHSRRQRDGLGAEVGDRLPAARPPEMQHRVAEIVDPLQLLAALQLPAQAQRPPVQAQCR